MRKRVTGFVLHQPLSFGSVRSDRWRSWTNAPAAAPGPLFRYLYVHHAAQSTSHSCSASGTFPAACARSQPTTAPAACPARVIARMSKQLAAVVVHSAEQDHRNALPLAVEVVHDVLASQRVSPVRGRSRMTALSGSWPCQVA